MRPSTIDVAIVDDHALVGQGLASLLTESPVGSAKTGIAVVHVGADPRQIPEELPLDVLVLDIDLGADQPKAEVTVESFAARGIPTLLVSALTSGHMVRRSILAGAAGYLAKSSAVSDLISAIRTITAGDLFLTPEMAAVLADSTAELSPRESEAVRMYAQGLPVKSIARRMTVTDHTVREYLKRAKIKVEATGRRIDNRVDWVAVATDQGLLQ